MPTKVKPTFLGIFLMRLHAISNITVPTHRPQTAPPISSQTSKHASRGNNSPKRSSHHLNTTETPCRRSVRRVTAGGGARLGRKPQRPESSRISTNSLLQRHHSRLGRRGYRRRDGSMLPPGPHVIPEIVTVPKTAPEREAPAVAIPGTSRVDNLARGPGLVAEAAAEPVAVGGLVRVGVGAGAAAR